MTIPFHEMHFLVSPATEFEYTATAMKKMGGTYVPVSPPHIGAGATPQAALLRVITPLREAEPSSAELAVTLRNCMTLAGISVKKLAENVDYSVSRLNDILNNTTAIDHRAYYDIAAHVIPMTTFIAELRRVQRRSDEVKDRA